MSVLSNWEAQLAEHSDGTLSLCVYHGAGRTRHNANALAKHDIVLTSYGILVQDETVLKRVRSSLSVLMTSSTQPYADEAGVRQKQTHVHASN